MVNHPRRSKLAERFWPKVSGRDNPAACWPWTGTLHGKGYGSIKLGASDGAELAHRVAYRLANGPITDGLHVLHRCDNRLCCNPAHLFLGTNADNMRDRDAKGRGTKPPVHSGETHHKATVTDAQVAEIRAATGTLKDIAARFGMSPSQIGALRRGEFRKAT